MISFACPRGYFIFCFLKFTITVAFISHYT